MIVEEVKDARNEIVIFIGKMRIIANNKRIPISQ
jgi:hypothetical protein